MKRALVVMAAVLVVAATCAAREIVISSTSDSGSGTLRWALQAAGSGDVTTFDPAVFPPNDPAVIYLIENWRCEYNMANPHGSLGYRPPAPQTRAPIPALAFAGGGRLD